MVARTEETKSLPAPPRCSSRCRITELPHLSSGRKGAVTCSSATAALQLRTSANRDLVSRERAAASAAQADLTGARSAAMSPAREGNQVHLCGCILDAFEGESDGEGGGWRGKGGS